MTRISSWTAEEDAVIAAKYPHLEKHELKGILEGRTSDEICKRASVLKVTKTPLTRKRILVTANYKLRNSTYL